MPRPGDCAPSGGGGGPFIADSEIPVIPLAIAGGVVGLMFVLLG